MPQGLIGNAKAIASTALAKGSEYVRTIQEAPKAVTALQIGGGLAALGLGTLAISRFFTANPIADSVQFVAPTVPFVAPTVPWGASECCTFAAEVVGLTALAEFMYRGYIKSQSAKHFSHDVWNIGLQTPHSEPIEEDASSDSDDDRVETEPKLHSHFTAQDGSINRAYIELPIDAQTMQRFDIYGADTETPCFFINETAYPVEFNEEDGLLDFSIEDGTYGVPYKIETFVPKESGEASDDLGMQGQIIDSETGSTREQNANLI